jgi:hypothetical protein
MSFLRYCIDVLKSEHSSSCFSPWTTSPSFGRHSFSRLLGEAEASGFCQRFYGWYWHDWFHTWKPELARHVIARRLPPSSQLNPLFSTIIEDQTEIMFVHWENSLSDCGFLTNTLCACHDQFGWWSCKDRRSTAKLSHYAHGFCYSALTAWNVCSLV